MLNTILVLAELSAEPPVGVLLQEVTVADAQPRILKDNGSVLRFEATLQDTKQNRNKRIYGADLLSEAIASPPVQDRLRTRSFFGESCHPFSPDLKRQTQIDLTRVSHLVTRLDQPKDGVVRGMLETAATQCGKDMRGLIAENGSQLAFSMRGAGAVRPVPGTQGTVAVIRPLAIFAYDWVSYPSHPSAYMDAQPMNEGCSLLERTDAISFACDQSANYKILVEQLELEPDGLRLTEDQGALVITAGRTIVAALLEKDVRQEFRRALRGL